MTPHKNFHHIIDQLEHLPAIPHIARKILSLKITSEEGERALFKLIEEDPIILSKVIGLANSPVYGTGRKILTLHDAAAVLGTKRVKMSALSLAMMTSLKRKPPGHLDAEKLWQHSLSVAVTMDTLGRFMPQEIRPSDEEIYLAGLLHDIGFLVLDFIDPQLSDEFHLHLGATPELSMEEIEANMLEMNHCELGAELARHWDLPESIVTVLRYHHEAGDPRAAGVRPLIYMVNIAGKLLSVFGFSETTPAEITDEEWQFLSIESNRADAIKEKVQDLVNKIAAMES